MQERRRSVRVPHRRRVPSCGSQALLPVDSYLTDVSERGLGLLVRESCPEGERLTVSFSLHDANDLITATGVVRWAASPRHRRRWRRVGLEWLGLQDESRHRLHYFLLRTLQAVTTPRPRGVRRWARPPLWLLGAGVVGGLLLTILCGWWVTSLRRENVRLQSLLHERVAMIQRLEQQHEQLSRDLAAAQRHVRVTTEVIAQLSQQMERLENGARRLQQDVARVQTSTTLLSPSSESRLLPQQTPSPAGGSMVSATELRRAIREAIARRVALREARAP